MGKIISLLGSGRSGTSQTALSLALDHSAKGKRVLLIHCEEMKGDEYVPGLGVSMRDLRPYIQSGVWTAEDVRTLACYRDDVFIIGGADDPASSSRYHPDKVGSFIKDMSSAFDIVLCDCGCRIDHGLSLGALIASDLRVCVLTQRENHLRRYEWQRPMLKRFGIDIRLAVVNEYEKRDPNDLGMISKRLGMDPGNVIRISFSDKGRNAEFYGRPLYDLKDKKYLKDIEAAGNRIENGI